MSTFKFKNFIKKFLTGFCAFYLASSEAFSVTYAIMVHGWTIYMLSFCSFLLLSSYFYHLDIKFYCRFVFEKTKLFFSKFRVTVSNHTLCSKIDPTILYHQNNNHYGLKLHHGFYYQVMRWVGDQGWQPLYHNHKTVFFNIAEQKSMIQKEKNFESVPLPASISSLLGEIVRLEKIPHRARRLIVTSCCFVVALLMGLLYAGLSYTGAVVFIYNTLLAHWAASSTFAFTVANVLAIPATLLLFALSTAEFCSILFFIYDNYHCLWQRLINVGQFCFGVNAQNQSNILVRSKIVCKLIAIFTACILSYLLSKVMTNLILYGFKRFCVVIFKFTVAPVLPSGIYIIVSLTFMVMMARSFFSTIEIFLNSDEFSKIELPTSLMGWLKFSFFMFFGSIRIVVQAITAQTFVNGNTSYFSSSFSGGFNEGRMLLESTVSELQFEQNNKEHPKVPVLAIKTRGL